MEKKSYLVQVAMIPCKISKLKASLKHKTHLKFQKLNDITDTIIFIIVLYYYY